MFGLEFMFNLRSAVFPYHMAPKFESMAVENNAERMCNSDEFKGVPLLLVFFPRILTEGSECSINLMTDISLDPQVNLNLVAVSTDTTETLKAWSEKREAGPPKITFVSDKNGDISRDYGVLDTENHESFHAVFIIDKQGIVQGSRKCYCGFLIPSTASEMMEFVTNSLQESNF